MAPLGRLHALWTLEGLRALTEPLIVAALKDPVPGVRENGIRLAEMRLNEYPALAKSLFCLEKDADQKGRVQRKHIYDQSRTNDFASGRHCIEKG